MIIKNRALTGLAVSAVPLAIVFLLVVGSAHIVTSLIYGVLAGVLMFFIWLLPANWRLTITSIFIAFFIIECLLRTFGWCVSAWYPGESATAKIYEYDQLLGWKKKPNATAVFSSWDNKIHTPIKINSCGLRDVERTFQKGPSVFRILMIGNSALAGFEVAQKYVLSQQLETMLNAQKSARKYEVINGGTRGYGTDQDYLFLQNEGLRYSPDVIIYLYSGNDLDDNITVHDPNRQYGKSYFVYDSTGDLTLKGVPVPQAFVPAETLFTVFNINNPMPTAIPVAFTPPSNTVTKKSFLERAKGYLAVFQLYCQVRAVLRANKSIEQKLVQYHILEDWPQIIDTSYHRTEKLFLDPYVLAYKFKLEKLLLQKMRHTADSAGVPLLVYEMTNGGGDKPPLPTDLEQMCDSIGIKYIRSFEEFCRQSHGKLVFRYPYDGHWNEKGHHLAATIIYKYLTDQ